MARPNKPSKKFKRDPTSAQRKINEYERALTGLFRNYKVRIIKDFTAMNARMLEAPARQPFKIGMQDAFNYLDKVEEEILIQPSKPIIKNVITKSWKDGQKFGSIQLGAPLEVRRGEWKKIANLIMKNEQAFTKITDDTSNAIRKTIGDGIIQERKFGDIARDIVKNVDGVGIVRATTMARTEVMEAVNAGIKDRYEQEGVEKVEWLTALDEVTCEECEEKDGEVYDIGDTPPCPAHPNCRCTLIPKIEIPEVD